MRVTGDRARDAQTLDDDLHGLPARAVPNGKGVQPVIADTPGEGWTLHVKPIAADGREYETSAELDKAIADAKARVASGKAADAQLVALAEPEDAKPIEDVKPLEVPRADH